jgi:hypothetical protein
MIRYAFVVLLAAMGLHTVWQAIMSRPLVIGFGHGRRINIDHSRWYHRVLWLCVGAVFLIGAAIFGAGIKF